MKQNYYWLFITKIKNGELYGGSQTLLAQLYISLENLVLSRMPTTESYKCIKEIEGHIEFLQFIQGDLVKNDFYTELFLISNKILDIISNSPIPNYDGNLFSLDSKVLTSGCLRETLNRIKYTDEPPSLVSLGSLRESIIDDLGPYITIAKLDKILFLIDNYMASIVSYHNGIDLLSNFKDGYRKALINDIINSRFTTILQECDSVYKLSDLLISIDQWLSNFFYSDGRIHLDILETIKLRVSTWVINDFSSFGYISQETLDLLKEEIIDKIDKFITHEKLAEYNLLYNINTKERQRYERHPYVQLGYEFENRIIQSFYKAVVAFTGDPKITLKTLGRILGVNCYQASEGKRFRLASIMKMVSTLERFIKEDTACRIPPNADLRYSFLGRLELAQRQQIYGVTEELITEYMKEFGIDRPWNWSEEHVKGYHIIRLLKRNLGFDLLSFTTLDKESFDRANSNNKFQRHHFRNSFFRKLSSYVQDLILTDAKHHVQYEEYSEAQILVIMDGFDRMMNMKGSGRDKNGNPIITKEDVIRIFKGNEWVLLGPDGNSGKDGTQGWFFNEKGFDQMLTEFNKRKSNLINKGLDQFLIDEYDTVYERFYLNFPHADAYGFYSLVEPHPWLGDLKMWMDFDQIYPYGSLPLIR